MAILSVSDQQPKMVDFGLVKASTSTVSGKLYTSHDLYKKHQLYYAGMKQTGFYPQIEAQDTKPGNMKVEDY